MIEIDRELLNKCVKCALCKSVCPTYKVNEEESSFARGRLALAEMVINNELVLTKDLAKAWDECALCRRCEWICPNNVEYKEIMVHARDYQQKTLGKDRFKDIALKSLEIMQSSIGRSVLKLSGKILSKVPKKEIKVLFPTGAKKYMPLPAKDAFEIRGKVFKAKEEKKKVLFFTGCMIDIFQTSVGKSAINLLNKAGYTVIVPRDIKCCGAPHIYSGNIESFNKLKDHNKKEIESYEFDMIAVACPTCGGALIEDYGYKNVFDTVELIKDLTFKGSSEKITFHVPCHSYSAMKINPKVFDDTLNKVENAEYKKGEKAQSCCGFAGLFSIKNPKLSKEIQREKIEDLKATKAQIVLSACPGCVLNLNDGALEYKTNQKVMHILDYLSERVKD